MKADVPRYLRHLRYDMKLKNKIVILCTAFFVVFAVVFYFMSYQHSIRILDKQADKNASSALEQADLHLSYILAEIDKIANVVAQQHEINELLYSSSQEADRVRQIENYFALKQIMNDILNSYDTYGITIYLPRKILYSQEGVMIRSEEDIDNRKLLSAITVRNGAALWSANERLTRSLDQHVTSQFKLLKHYYTNAQIGVIEVYAENRIVKDILNKVSDGMGSITCLIDGKGGLIATNAEHSVFGQSDAVWIERVLNGAMQGSFKTGSGSRSELVVYQKQTATGWTLVTLIPDDLLYTSSKNVRNLSILTILAVLLIVTLLIYLLLNNFTKRITRLVRVMSHIENDGFKIAVPRRYNDEIGDLEKRFNDMSQEINTLIAEIYRAERMKKEAQFSALQAQINPHFLYNTLDTINWMAIDQDAYNISTMITALSKFFRFSLSEGNEIITFGDELEIVKQYVLMQKIRYDDDLQVEYRIAESVLACDIVKLTLQPIIENALKHGIQPSERPGELRIEADVTPDSLVEIRVADNGVGLGGSETDAPDGHEPLFRTGYGMKNVLERLTLNFGEGCSITIADGERSGAVVVIRFPARRHCESA